MEAHRDDRTTGGDEVAALTQVAYEAARQGRIEELELHLARLRMAGAKVKSLGDELYAIARAVRAHPSYKPQAADGRAAV